MKSLLLTCFLFCTGLLTNVAFSQTGPWAKYDQDLKDGALYREASSGNLGEVKSIVAGGGNVHYSAKQTKGTILMAAAGSGKIEVVRYLLSLGVDPNAKDWWDQTALDKARSVGAKDIEALLKEAMAAKQGPPVEKPQVAVNPPANTTPAATPAPVKQDSPAEAPRVVQKPVKTPVQVQPKNTLSAPAKWPVFGSYNVGDSVLYWTPVGWRRAVVAEVGVKAPVGKISVDYSFRKYLVDPDAYALGNDWYEWSGVVKLDRQPFWTGWFIGEWSIGEVQAHNNEVKAGKETDTYYYMDAAEMLQVYANNTYRWKLIDGKVVTGKWVPVPNEPGIILQKAYRNFDWTMRNSTSVDDWRFRKLDLINLKPSAMVMSVNGKRKTTE